MGNSVPKELKFARASIAVDKQCYSAGSQINGYVEVVIDQPMNVQDCFVTFASTCSTSVRYQSGSGKNRRTRTARESEVLESQRAHVAHFPSGTAGQGSYRFPFAFNVSPGAQSSMSIRAMSDTASIVHTLSVGLNGVGQKQKQRQHTYEVHNVVINIAGLAPGPEPAVVSDTKEIVSCGCFNQGPVHLSAQIPQNVVFAGQPIEVESGVMNESSKSARVEVAVYRRAFWTARNHRSKRSMVALVSSYVGEALAPGQGYGEKAGSAPLKTQLVVPADALPNVQCRLLSLANFARVQVVIPGGISNNPSVDIPLVIHANQEMAMAHHMQQQQMQMQMQMQQQQADAPPAYSEPVAYHPETTANYMASPAPVRAQGVPLDTNNDGFADAMGYDTNGDGMVDTIVPNQPGPAGPAPQTMHEAGPPGYVDAPPAYDPNHTQSK